MTQRHTSGLAKLRKQERIKWMKTTLVMSRKPVIELCKWHANMHKIKGTFSFRQQTSDLLVKPSGWPTDGVGPDAWWPCSRVLLGGRPAASSCFSPWWWKPICQDQKCHNIIYTVTYDILPGCRQKQICVNALTTDKKVQFQTSNSIHDQGMAERIQ